MLVPMPLRSIETILLAFLSSAACTMVFISSAVCSAWVSAFAAFPPFAAAASAAFASAILSAFLFVAFFLERASASFFAILSGSAALAAFFAFLAAIFSAPFAAAAVVLFFSVISDFIIIFAKDYKYSAKFNNEK